MNLGRACPAGWLAFRMLRQRPADLPRLCHGNYRHGWYSKGTTASMVKVRALARVLRRPHGVPDGERAEGGR